MSYRTLCARVEPLRVLRRGSLSARLERERKNFFAWCNLRCVFCHNHEISQAEAVEEVSPRRLAGVMLELQEAGCHNINWVTSEHAVPQILESLPLAIEDGLPIVYNMSGYDSMGSLRQMDGIVDIYIPDFK